MSLAQFLRILAARRAIILATLLACVIAATIAVQLLPPRYESRTRVLIDLTKPDVFAGQISSQAMNSYIATQLRLIKDVQTAGLVIDGLGWAADTNNQAAFEAAGRPGGDIRDWLAQRIVDGTEAQFVEASSIIEISYRGTDPASTQGIAQAIREAFLKLTRDQRINVAQRSAASFDEQARRAASEVERSENERTAYAKANGIIIQPGNIDLESSRLAAMAGAAASPAAMSVVPGEPSNPQIGAIRQQLAQAQLTLGPNHPAIQALQRQLATQQAELARTSGRIIQGASRADIEASYQAQRQRVLGQSEKIDRLNKLASDASVKRDQYLRLSAKAEEFKAMALAGETAMEPLGNTSLPNEPVWPHKPLVIAGAAALGLVLGILLSLLVELMARRVRSEDDLEYASGVPVLAVVGRPRESNALVTRLVNFVDRDRGKRRETLSEA